MLNNYRSYTKKANLAYKSLDRFNLQNTLGKTEKFYQKFNYPKENLDMIEYLFLD